MRIRFITTIAALLMTAATAHAQSGGGWKSLGVRGFVNAGSQSFSATDSFDAIFGTSRGTFIGGGGQLTWRRMVFEVSASRFEKTGERVFILDGEVFRLGIPATVNVRPIEFSGFYRLPQAWRITPYAGGGVGRQRYKEVSNFADADENVEGSHTTYHVAGGAEVQVWRWIGAAGELRYRRAPDALGEGGVSKEFDETDLGGTTVAFKIIVGR